MQCSFAQDTILLVSQTNKFFQYFTDNWSLHISNRILLWMHSILFRPYTYTSHRTCILLLIYSQKTRKWVANYFVEHNLYFLYLFFRLTFMAVVCCTLMLCGTTVLLLLVPLAQVLSAISHAMSQLLPVHYLGLEW